MGGYEDNMNVSADAVLVTPALPEIPDPVGTFEVGVATGNLLFLSGQGPVLENGCLATGKVGLDVDSPTAYEHARRAGLVLLAAAERLLGSLDNIEQVVKVFGMVNAVPDFEEHPRIIDGCSDVLVEVLGPRGRHARSAVGMSSLPGNITVEVEAILAVRNR